MDIDLRQSYERVAKKALHKQSSHARANQFKKARKQTKKLKICLGRVTRDIRRKMKMLSPVLEKLLSLSDKVLSQERSSKNKIYSIHETEVECISKGKPHKKYEFGVKLDLLLQPPPIGYLEQRPSMVILMMGILLKRALSRYIELQELNLNRQLVIWAIASMITRANA